MKKSCYVLIVIFAVLPAFAFAQTAISAKVNKTKISQSEALVYELTVSSAEKNISKPQLPEFEGFAVISRSQGSRFSMEKDKTKTEISYYFALAAQAPGKFKINPATIRIDKETLSSQAFDIEVTPVESAPIPEKRAEPSAPQQGLPEPDKPKITL